MMALITCSEIVPIFFCSYLLWRCLRPFIVKSSFADIPGPPKTSWWKGNYHQIFDRHGWQYHHDIVEKYGDVVKLSGFFGAEQLYVTDPRALDHILVKDQYAYEETRMFIATNTVIFGSSLLSTIGDHHRRQRKMLNPVFSTKNMRELVDVFYPVAHQLRDVFRNKIKNGEEEINVMNWMSRAALEYIGQGGLGYSFDAFNENKTNTYSDAIKMLGPVAFDLILVREALPYIFAITTPSVRRRFVDWAPSKLIKHAKRIIDIMDSMSREIYTKKKKALELGDEQVVSQVGRGKDIMSILLQANMSAHEIDKLSEEELIGQMSLFIFAGLDTTGSALSRTLHLLSLHPDAQQKLREEVTKARQEHGDLDYDTLLALPYLDAVCRETLRVYPPSPFRVRTTTKDIVMPLQMPIKSVEGKKEITEILLKKNTNVIISILGANLSKAIWGDDAEEWKPERWLAPLPESVAAARMPGVYSSILTFSGGGRSCIGFKYAELEMKVVLLILLESFSFSPTKEIYWNMGGIQTPILKGSGDNTPQLPLKVSLVHNNEE